MGSTDESFFTILFSRFVNAPVLMHVRTLEHWVLAGDKFAFHLESEFVPIHRLEIGDMVVLHSRYKSFPILGPTATPQTRSESCCRVSHFIRLS